MCIRDRDIIFPNPKLSKAVISAFNTADPVCLKIPIPLVAPIAGKLEITLLPSKPICVDPKSVVTALPMAPPALLPFLL